MCAHALACAGHFQFSLPAPMQTSTWCEIFFYLNFTASQMLFSWQDHRRLQRYDCHSPSLRSDTKSCCDLEWRKVGGDVITCCCYNFTYSLFRETFPKAAKSLFPKWPQCCEVSSRLLTFQLLCIFPSHLVVLSSITQVFACSLQINVHSQHLWK